MVPLPVPLIQKPDSLICHILIQKVRDFRIAVNLHVLCQERMIVSIIRIILGCVPFCQNRVDRQIQEQSGIFPDDLCDGPVKEISIHHFSDDKISSDTKTAAAFRFPCLFRQPDFWKIPQEICIGNHHPRLVFACFPDADSFGAVILFLPVILPGVFEINIRRIFNPLGCQFSMCFRHSYPAVQVHIGLPI